MQYIYNFIISRLENCGVQAFAPFGIYIFFVGVNVLFYSLFPKPRRAKNMRLKPFRAQSDINVVKQVIFFKALKGVRVSIKSGFRDKQNLNRVIFIINF